MGFFRRKRRPNPSIAAWIVAFHEERASAPPWQHEFSVPDRIRVDRDGNVTQP